MQSVKLSIIVISCSLIASSYGQAGQTGRYPDKYNLIDPDPSCRYDIPSNVCCVGGYLGPQCPLIYQGPGDIDVMAIYPNIQERTDYLMRNMARLYPSFYSHSEYGWGGSYAGDCDKPTITPTLPFYFMSEAVQAARWNSFSGATTYSGCKRGDSTTYPNKTCNDAQTGHYTCCKYCEYNVWGSCGYNYRTKAMIQLLFTSNAFNDVGSEGNWGGNTALITSAAHCGMVFNHEYNHQGIGSYPSGTTSMVGIKDTEDWEDHVLPHGTHFDWDENDFSFLVQFFGGKKSTPIIAEKVLLLYDGQWINMALVTGDYSSGFFRVNLNSTTECEPYAFLVKDINDGSWWRLPEDERYYFATVNKPTDLLDGTANCMENHYFYTGTEYVANGGEGLINAKNTANGCIGCDKILLLDNIYNNRNTIAFPTISPTITTNAPSVPPTTAAPTDENGTAKPTTTKPTTAIPTINPTINPTTAYPSVSPSIELYGYILDTERMTWNAANDACYDRYGSELATIYNDDTSARYLLSLAGNSNTWIGLNDYDTEGKWEHVDGTLCEENTDSTTDNCANLPYWKVGEPNNQFSDQHAGYIEGGSANGDINVMLADTRGWYNNYQFICNPQRTKYPTSATDSPTTLAPTAPSAAPTIPTDCGDYQCVNVTGLGTNIDGSWIANGYNCIYSKSYYTNGKIPGVYFCLAGSSWTFTTSIDVTTNECATGYDNRLAYCTKARAEMSFCDTDNAWKLSDANGGFIDITDRVTLSRSYDLSNCITPVPTTAPTTALPTISLAPTTTPITIAPTTGTPTEAPTEDAGGPLPSDKSNCDGLTVYLWNFGVIIFGVIVGMN
eukprot:118783_1